LFGSLFPGKTSNFFAGVWHFGVAPAEVGAGLDGVRCRSGDAWSGSVPARSLNPDLSPKKVNAVG
jgi:hypothetical protein